MITTPPNVANRCSLITGPPRPCAVSHVLPRLLNEVAPRDGSGGDCGEGVLLAWVG